MKENAVEQQTDEQKTCKPRWRIMQVLLGIAVVFLAALYSQRSEVFLFLVPILCLACLGTSTKFSHTQAGSKPVVRWILGAIVVCVILFGLYMALLIAIFWGNPPT